MMEPLKNKKECFSTLCYRDKGVKCNHSFHERDVLCAVEWLKKEIKKDRYVGDYDLVPTDIDYIIGIIDLAFEDITKGDKG